MSNNGTIPPVESEEFLSRFILHKSHVRQDNTLRADSFIPHPHADLSVTRHLDLDKSMLWDIGEEVARQTGKAIHGRGENQAFIYPQRKLAVIPAPVPGNRNHANITGWPADKPSQKIIALEIAAITRFVPRNEQDNRPK
jgi:hypothetical protein